MPPRGSGRRFGPVEPAKSSKGRWVAAALLAVAGLGYVWLRPGGDTLASSDLGPVEIGSRHLYSASADPKAEIAAALAQAAHEHKRVILDFGGDWCVDCQVLDIYFHQGSNGVLLAKNFLLVHVWIGQMDANLELAASYGVPIDRGVPALAVLAADGTVLYAQRMGEFDKMRAMNPSTVTEFLNQWKS